MSTIEACDAMVDQRIPALLRCLYLRLKTTVSG